MTTAEIDWDAYATQYDRMCSYNPSYNENLTKLMEFLSNSDCIKEGSQVADLGAGTGNFLAHLATSYPLVHFLHVDSNRAMNEIALKKYRGMDLSNVTVLEEPVQTVALEEGSLDLALCVHSLYAMPPQDIVLRKIQKWLKPGGILYVVDLGRSMRPIDWGLHFFQRAATSGQIGQYVKDAISSREVVRQNRLTRVAQDSGRYWTHTTQQFGDTLEKVGFQLERLEQAYRGYSDLAICKKLESQI